MSAALSVPGLVAGYGATGGLEGVSHEVPRGGTLAVLGRTGAGKTT